jgi:hypothetical protein
MRKNLKSGKPKPAQIITKFFFIGGKFNDLEVGRVARNIVVICKKSDKWIQFSFEDYVRLCNQRIDQEEERVLKRMVCEGWLTKIGGKYSITDKFFEAISEFHDTSEIQAGFYTYRSEELGAEMLRKNLESRHQ